MSMGVMKKITLTIIILLAIAAIVTVLVILLLPQAPSIPHVCTDSYDVNGSCFDCHETGENDAPLFPSGHQDKIDSGEYTDDIDSCLKCHDRKE
jgi:hypothetical protein